MSTAEQPNTLPRMTYEEFLDWADEDTLAEWVDGEVVMTSPASDRHQEIVYFLEPLLKRYTRFHQLGKVRGAPFQMKLSRSGREPDIFFVANEHLDRLKKTYLDGPADLVIEILSPESVRRDRMEKYYEYQAAGIKEYWMIDPNAETAEFFQLAEDGTYHRIAPDDQGIYHSSVVPGFWLRIEWLWQDPLPEEEDVRLEILGQAFLDRVIERGRQLGMKPTTE